MAAFHKIIVSMQHLAHTSLRTYLDHCELFNVLETVPPNEVGVPHECGMGASSSCQIVLGVWSLGFSGHCLPDEAGIRIGPNKYTQGAIQVCI